MHIGAGQEHEDLIEMILVFLLLLNITLMIITFNAQHSEDHRNALSLSSTSRLWVTMATHGYSRNGSKTNWGVSR